MFKFSIRHWLLLCLMWYWIFTAVNGVDVVTIDGMWSPWSTRASPCFMSPLDQTTIVMCGVGFSRRYRSCTNPTPQGGGKNCSGVSEQWLPCNTQACQLPYEFLWSSWSPCSAFCGKGLRNRHTMCGTVRERAPGAIKTLEIFNKNNGTNSSTSPASTKNYGNTTLTTLSTNTITTRANTMTTASTTTGTTTTTTLLTTTALNVASTTTTGNAITTTTGGGGTTTALTTTPSVASTTVIAPNSNLVQPDMLSAYELGYEERCSDNQYEEDEEECHTWSLTDCPDPCLTATCPFSSKCYNKSNSTAAVFVCVCQLGLIMKSDGSACIVPPPTTTSPRPIPSLAPPEKAAANVLTRGASFVLIGFLIATIVIFALLGIVKETSRIIHLNMEISLLCAHICLIPPGVYNSDQGFCRVLSIGIHFFFTSCFFFMFLEAVHLYSLVGWVVRRGGMLNGAQNTCVGWGGAFIVVLFCLCFEYMDYGGLYHCWLQMDKPIVYGQLIPIGVLTIMALTILEAAGSADDFEPLDDHDKDQRITAQVMQRTLVFILPLVFVSFILGTVADYEQDLALYSIFTIINGVLGGIIFFFHCSANESVRYKVVAGFRKVFGKKSQQEVEPINQS